MKNLSIAFIWHFHQPNYQSNPNGDFLLPWVRLHASKDYLDMLKKVDLFKNLKLNFDFSPVLLGSLQKYAAGAKDLHLKLLLKDKEELTNDDKLFILNNYFDLNYKNMVLKRPYFSELYNRRTQATKFVPDIFNLQEYSDIMANFTLLWIDETFIEDYPELKNLYEKEKNYTFEDRLKIYEIQLDIIKRILKEYKKYQLENKIEVSISPYYHPILPLLINFKDKEIKNLNNLPDDFSRMEDAKEQINLAIEKYEEIFGIKPKGLWLPEQCVSEDTTDFIAKQGLKWTVLDEGILSKTLGKEFIRDFDGNLEDPFRLDINYVTDTKNPLNIIFRDAFFAGLLNFSCGNYEPKQAAADIYEKIKTIQTKLQNSPKENHILTIALDGENCWETYPDDGNYFLKELYGLICSDETLKTVTVSDFIDKNSPEKIKNLSSGSWINRNFDLWISESVKNVAWLYLSSVCADFENYRKNNKDTVSEEKIKNAYKEILISESSDWYWWYGEPNKSKNDDIFDFLFRNHLMNVYRILELEIPDYLKIPLTISTTKSLKNPAGKISPSLCCDIKDAKNEWEKAGHIFIPDSPTSDVTKLIKNIYFGADDDYLYLRIELNRNSVKIAYDKIENQIAIYIINKYANHYSPVRFVNKNENTYPIIKNHFSNELRLIFNEKEISRIFLNQAIDFGLWAKASSKKSSIKYDEIIELKISFEDLKIDKNNKDFAFCILDATDEMINEVYPQDILIRMH